MIKWNPSNVMQSLHYTFSYGLQEASFQGGNVKFSKYLDSFPFPFYVVLKNIEALPRTLADLLRQVSFGDDKMCMH